MAGVIQSMFDALNAKIDDIQKKIDDKKAEIKALEEKIERLKDAEKAVKKQKENAEKLRTNTTKRKLNKGLDLDWEGSRYDEYVSLLEGDVKTNFDTYITEIDDRLDKIVDKRTKYENKVTEKTTILDGLWTTFNNLCAEITKAFN